VAGEHQHCAIHCESAADRIMHRGPVGKPLTDMKVCFAYIYPETTSIEAGKKPGAKVLYQLYCLQRPIGFQYLNGASTSAPIV
jgi:hypothetical protein